MKIQLSKQDIKLFEETLNEKINFSLNDIFSDDYLSWVIVDSFRENLSEEIGKELWKAIEKYTKDNLNLIKICLKKYM